MGRKLAAGETRKRSVSLSLSDEVLDGLDRNCELLRARIRDGFDWSECENADSVIDGINRSLLVRQLVGFLSTPQGLEIVFNSMSLGFESQGIHRKTQTDLFT